MKTGRSFRRTKCGDDSEIHDVSGVGKAQLREDGDKGALFQARFLVRHRPGDIGDGANKENHKADNGGPHRLRKY
jgi:hypothetical protein